MHVIWYNFCYRPEWRIFPRVHLAQNKMYHAMFDLLFSVLMQEIAVRKETKQTKEKTAEALI